MRVCDESVRSFPNAYLCLETEEYHNTPETQTDESYTHPEDM